jgi:type IV pilus assembly protein PilM
MWNEKVTLYIDDTSIRLLVCQGQRIKKWADLVLEPEMVKGSVVTKEGEVVTKIKQLFESQKVTTRRVILGYSGLHSLTRPATLPQLPKAMIPEAVAREARRVLPVPLDQLYLTWCTIPCPPGRVQVFLTGTPRKTADSLIQVLRGAGLEPTHIIVKPLVLTRALGKDVGILVDIQPAEYDIVIVYDGVPQPIRTVAFPNQELTWEQKLDMIVSDLERTIKFYDTNNPEKHLNMSIPIFISGEFVNHPEFNKSLSEKSGHPVQILIPNMKGQEQIGLERYMVNIAMAMKATAASNEANTSIGNMNLLPSPYRPKPISLTKAFGIPGGVAVAGLVIPMVMMIQTTSANITTQQAKLDTVTQQINQKNQQRLELQRNVDDLQSKVDAAQLTYDNFDQSWKMIKAQQEHVKGDLAITLSDITSTVTLNKVNLSENLLILSGTAPNQEDIYMYAQGILQYARSLDLSGRYQSSIVSSLKTSGVQTGSENQQGDGATNGGTQEDIDSPENPPNDQIEFVLTFERRGE